MKRAALSAVVLVLLTAQAPRSVYNEGIRAAMDGNLQKANAALSRAAVQQPRESEGYYVHYWLGVVRAALGDDAGALKEWRESVRQGVSPAHTDVLQRIAVLEKQQDALGRAERAERDARFLSARATPSYHKANVALERAHTLQAAGKVDDAKKAANEAVVLYRQAQAEPRSQSTAMNPPKPDGDAALFDEIDRRFAELSPGEIVFTAPETMRVADTSEVSLRIAAKNHTDGILEGLTDGVTSTAVQEHITPVMEARLDGGSGVDVQTLGKDAQSVAGGGFAEWRWNVTPKRSGAQKLTVSIIAHLTYPDGHDVPKTIRTLTRNVTVSANVGNSIGGFFASYWQWLTTTLIIPIAIFFYRRRANRDTVAAASGTPSANAEKK